MFFNEYRKLLKEYKNLEAKNKKLEANRSRESFGLMIAGLGTGFAALAVNDSGMLKKRTLKQP